MSVDTRGIMDNLVSHALTLGKFENVNKHEPDNAPGSGLHGALWVNTIRPMPQGSGVQSTSGVFIFNFRLYTSGLSEPKDEIDPIILEALDALMTAYSGDFELDDGLNVRCIDLLGMSGTSLSAQAGYVNSPELTYRVMTLTIPIIVNDVWDLVP